jgi:hypothetical protein
MVVVLVFAVELGGEKRECIVGFPGIYIDKDAVGFCFVFA